MSVFMLETSVLDSASSALSNIASQVLELGNNVSGYDTSCEDGFDFASVKKKIASNIEACSTKIQNTASILNSVSQSHTQLQNSLKFEDPTAAKKSTGGSRRSGGSYGYYAGGYSGSSYFGGVSSTSANSKDDLESVLKIENNFTSVGYAYVNNDALSSDSKQIFSDDKFKYDENGYARLDDYYVISTTASVGKVGDLIKFTQKDGTVVETIVGINTTDEKYADTINFIVSQENSSEFNATDLTENLLENNTKIENFGNYKLIEKDNNVITQVSTDNLNVSMNDASKVEGSNSANEAITSVEEIIEVENDNIERLEEEIL